jgi:uncharacterized membrane protein
MGLLYVAAGTLHFVFTQRYMAMVPSYLPAHRALVWISGAAELAGGVGVLAPFPVLQRAAARGLVVLLLAVFPANVSMIGNHAAYPRIPVWALWARLPMQVPLLYWAWLYARQERHAKKNRMR